MKLFKKYLPYSLSATTLLSCTLSFFLISQHATATEKAKHDILPFDQITTPFEQYKFDSTALYSFLAGYRKGNWERSYMIVCTMGPRVYPKDVIVDIYEQGYRLGKKESYVSMNGFHDIVGKNERRVQEVYSKRYEELLKTHSKSSQQLVNELKEERNKRASAESKVSFYEFKLKRLEFYRQRVKELEQELAKVKD